MHKISTFGVYPKVIPPLSPAQQQAKEEAMREWHEQLPNGGFIAQVDKFNQGWVASLPKVGAEVCRTLEVGPGLGEHLRWEDLKSQDYYALEYRESFCDRLRATFPTLKVLSGDIQAHQPFADGHFDRVIAIHVLEHLPDLPAALGEISRLLNPAGALDIVIPCEGSLLYSLGRRLSSQRFFEKKWKMPYAPIIASEHLSVLPEIVHELIRVFDIETTRWFPLPFVPVFHANLCCGMRLRKKR